MSLRLVLFGQSLDDTLLSWHFFDSLKAGAQSWIENVHSCCGISVVSDEEFPECNATFISLCIRADDCAVVRSRDRDFQPYAWVLGVMRLACKSVTRLVTETTPLYVLRMSVECAVKADVGVREWRIRHMQKMAVMADAWRRRSPIRRSAKCQTLDFRQRGKRANECGLKQKEQLAVE